MDHCLLNSSEARCFGLFVRCLPRRCLALTTAIGPVVQGVTSASRAGMALDVLLPRAFFRRQVPPLFVVLTAFQVAESLSVRFNTVRGKCLFLFYWCEDQ